mgnify:FL=1|jgi:U3 small nucleolar RNA-associated protein 4
MSKVLPTVLSHPTVSLASVVVKDPEYFQSADITRRVPRLEELRLFTAGSDSGDIVERCLLTGRILVRHLIFQNGSSDAHLCLPAANICHPWCSGLGDVHCAHARSTGGRHQQSTYSLFIHLPLLHLSGTFLASHADGGDTRPDQDSFDRMGSANQSAFTKWRTSRDGWKDVGVAKSLPGDGQLGFELEEVECAKRTNDWANGGQQVAERPGQKSGEHCLGRWRVSVSFVSFNFQPLLNGASNRDHTIVSSDSLGSVTFWDGKSQAQLQTFQAHVADALCLTIGPVSC